MTFINIPSFMLQMLVAKYIFGCTLVWTPHNVTPHNQQYPHIHQFCRRFFAAQMKWIRVFSSATITKMAATLHVKAEQCKVVPEGSYVSYYTNNTNREAARNQLKIAASHKVLLYLGYIKPYKGITELLEAFQQWFGNDSNAKLIIAGQVMDQDYFKTIQPLVGPQVQIINRFIANDDLQYYMQAADLVVLPFKKIENSGSVILAMGFEKPVIAPNMGVITQRLKAQPQLLYQQHLSESFEVFKSLTIAELQIIGKQNAKALEPFQWVDFAKEFTKP
jgi:glycosyltransferase involved in cell wall biosynthesis